MLERRTFLRGLTSLPLIGGSVALIGQPTAAAVPVTDALHARYVAWLAHEHHAAMKEHAWRGARASWTPHPANYEPTAEACADRCMKTSEYIGWRPDVPDIIASVATARPSTRAAVILSAAGVPLTGGLARG